jgi:hypothetical protein
MSRILNRQRQLAEAGRLRLGLTSEYTRKDGKKGTKPVRSETWILTSHSEEIVRAAATSWGGTPERWQPLGNGAQQWRVITQAAAIDAFLPPGDPLTQAYETWSRGGAQRRCDGVTEQFSGSPCLCAAQFGDKWYERPKGEVCDTKTRLKVLLADMPGLGSYRVETGSYYAADEIAGMVDFIRGQVDGLVPVRLRIEPRTRVAGGETKQFVVPVVELRGVTTAQILGGTDLMASVGGRAAAQQIEAAPTTMIDLRAESAACTTKDQLRVLLERVREVGPSAVGMAWDDAVAILTERARIIDAVTDPDDTDDEVDPDLAWEDVLKAGGQKGWTLKQIEATYADRHNGVHPSDASGAALAAFAAWIRSDGAEAAA